MAISEDSTVSMGARIAATEKLGSKCSQAGMQKPEIRTPHKRPRTGQRWSDAYHLPSPAIHSLFFTALILSLLCASTEANGQPGCRAHDPRSVGRIGEILFDARPSPEPALQRRTEASSIAAPDANATKTSSSAVATSILSAPTDSNSPLPKPFDGGIGTNFTQPSCPTFIKTMISNDTFTSCLPFSLLLQNSVSFFSASRTLSSITATLDASCNIVFTQCSAIMSTYALQLRSSSTCAQDYDRQNPMIRQAYAGLKAYDVLYRASCLKNNPNPQATGQNNNNYCFANAITNASNPMDSYVYYLPLGIPLPPGSLPTCSGCLKDTMALFATAASNKSQPLNLDYVDAATMVDRDCGPYFVNATIMHADASSAATNLSRNPTWVAIITIMVTIGMAHMFI